MKYQIINELGASYLLLPKAINDGLVANDRVKYFFTLLQLAKSSADDPEHDHPDLKKERLICNINNTSFDTVIKQTTKDQNNNYKISEMILILENIKSNIKEMLMPLEISAKVSIEDNKKLINYKNRFESLVSLQHDMNNLSGLMINQIISANRDENDSLHILVMDLHKELNKLQSEISDESVSGAKVYSIQEQDRDLINAFMSGLNKTSPLKFDHPGLGTTATRSGDSLIIQNDIGSTDAHVLVIKIKNSTVTLTYTDVHMQRLVFFKSLFENFTIEWQEVISKNSKNFQDEGTYQMCIGIYRVKDIDDLKKYLSYLGSRIVFLIDWNRVRKRLRNFLNKNDCSEVLKWAADNDYGHMGFLRMGGDQLIYDAIESTGKNIIKFGQQFDEVLGKENAINFLKFVIKTCSTGLLEGKSEALIRNEIRAELTNYFQSAYNDMLDLTSRHATLVLEIATCVRDGVIGIRYTESKESLGKNAIKAKKWETKADLLVNEMRFKTKNSTDTVAFQEILHFSDDVADALEESVFLLPLVPNDVPLTLYDSLQELADLIIQGSREYLKAIENAKHIQNSTSREEIDDFLQAVDNVFTLEHRSDDALRNAKVIIMKETKDHKQIHILSEITSNIETASDGLMKASLELRDYVLDKLITK
ncbi:MAG: hypothetical protein D4R72_03320 [Nitrosopumilales archaeon]|nr:MAG: hypothetical protein D4R72_03320 [Nitrosopumilales archaeon]